MATVSSSAIYDLMHTPDAYTDSDPKPQFRFICLLTQIPLNKTVWAKPFSYENVYVQTAWLSYLGT